MRLEAFRQDRMGFNAIQSIRLQTGKGSFYRLADHGVDDSFSEPLKEWTDPAAELPEDAVGRDRLLTSISVHGFSGTADSSPHHRGPGGRTSRPRSEARRPGTVLSAHAGGLGNNSGPARRPTLMKLGRVRRSCQHDDVEPERTRGCMEISGGRPGAVFDLTQ
ncbi:hypothetical protein ADK34_21495 [Streptomyces viridochromogenes]|uniref:Uncharacterized protein n=1 Tax=Streptomyces viridochromogenes TaxID=1938 RepID=A0A0L8K9I8_STRVR|nr:hypothetical protein ADK34_21495 [Streptomyces viridochromogenes]